MRKDRLRFRGCRGRTVGPPISVRQFVTPPVRLDRGGQDVPSHRFAVARWAGRNENRTRAANRGLVAMLFEGMSWKKSEISQVAKALFYEALLRLVQTSR